MPELMPQENLEGSLFEDFPDEDRKPASQAKAPRRLVPKRMAEEPKTKEDDLWEMGEEPKTKEDDLWEMGEKPSAIDWGEVW